jgi:hypothetical protein
MSFAKSSFTPFVGIALGLVYFLKVSPFYHLGVNATLKV